MDMSASFHAEKTCLCVYYAVQAPIRRIGRCDLGTKLDPPWPCTLKDAFDVFTFDEKDPVRIRSFDFKLLFL